MNDSYNVFRQKFLLSFGLFMAVIAGGTLGFWVLGEGRYPLFDCLYMTVITVSTVGFGEVIEIGQSVPARSFTMFLIFSGMSVILYFVSNVTAFLIEGNLKEFFWRRNMRKLIDGLNGHYIVCGAGQIGLHIVQELYQTKRPAVVIEASQDKIRQLMETYPGVGLVHGDATENEALEEAGIARASGIIVSTANDKDNIVITITARQLNSNLRIVARCNEIKHIEKLKRAGADSVVSSNYIGGLRMASEMLRPAVVSFLDNMLRDRKRNLRIEEITIPQASPLSGDKVARIKGHGLLLAVKTGASDYEFNPSDDFLLTPGMTLVFMASPEDRARLEGLIAAP